MNEQQQRFEEPQGAGQVPGRGAAVLVVVALALGLIGFLVGMRQGATPYTPPPPRERPQVDLDVSVVPAMHFAEFHPRVHGPNAAWQSHLASLEQPELDLFAEIEWDEQTRLEVQAARAERRAHPGAPPVVPHPTDALGTASCLACHASGLAIAGVRAPAMGHEPMASCTQCHVEQTPRSPSGSPAPENHFSAYTAPLAGERAWPGAPPTIPHPTHMRENCAACHGPGGIEPFRTSHPWQASCLQCHAPSAALDQAVGPGTRSFLPPQVRTAR